MVQIKKRGKKTRSPTTKKTQMKRCLKGRPKVSTYRHNTGGQAADEHPKHYEIKEVSGIKRFTREGGKKKIAHKPGETEGRASELPTRVCSA